MSAYDPEHVKPSPSDWVARQAETYEASGGTEATDMNGSPCLLLDYQGRSSGDWHRTVLIYGRDGDDYLVVASKGGTPEPPAWYLNLSEQPDVRVQVKADCFNARARTATAEEKPELWRTMAEIWPAYDEYQGKTDREIPVVVLERRA